MTQPAKPSAIPAPPPVPIRGTDPFPVFATKSANWVDWQSGSLYQYIVDSIDFIDLSNTYVSEQLTLATDAAAAASSSADSAAASAASALDSKTLAEAAVASIPAGTINDLLIAPDKAWSSGKIDSEFKANDTSALAASNWTSRPHADNAVFWDTVVYSPDLDITVSEGNKSIATTNDSINWTLRASLINTSPSDIVWCGGSIQKFVAAGAGSYTATSNDGITFTELNNNPGSSTRGLVFLSDIERVVGVKEDGSACYSDDGGTTFTQVTTGFSSYWASAAYNGSRVVAVTSIPSSTVVAAKSDDGGVTWSAVASINSDYRYKAIAYIDFLGLFVACGRYTIDSSKGVISISSDGDTFTDVYYVDGTFASIAYKEGIVVFTKASGNKRVAISRDCATFKEVSTPEINQWLDVAFCGDVFTAVSNTGTNRAMTSLFMGDI